VVLGLSSGLVSSILILEGALKLITSACAGLILMLFGVMASWVHSTCVGDAFLWVFPISGYVTVSSALAFVYVLVMRYVPGRIGVAMNRSFSLSSQLSKTFAPSRCGFFISIR